MKVRRLRMMNAGGDKTIFEWNPETVSQDRLAEIEAEFKQKMREGWFAADITDKRNVLIDKFDPQADILLIPRMQGGVG